MSPPKGWHGTYSGGRAVSTAMPFRGLSVVEVSDQIMLVGLPNAYGEPKVVFISFAKGPLFVQAMTPDELQAAVKLAQHPAKERVRAQGNEKGSEA